MSDTPSDLYYTEEHEYVRPTNESGVFTIGIATARFINEFFRQPDAHLTEFAASSGLSMGQWLSIPMILVGVAVVVYALRNPSASKGAPLTASES